MSEKLSMNLKVSALTKALIAECARIDHRTVSAYVEAMVEIDAKNKNVTLETVPEKKQRVKSSVGCVTAPDLPNYLDKELWDDWCAYRSKQGKPMVLSTLKYSIREMEKAHANGWDVNELISKALANQWTGFVFDKHRDTRADGKEIIVSKVSKEEIEDRINTLLKMDCLYVASIDVWRNLFETAFENGQCLSVSDVANICKVLRKINGNKYTVASDDRLNAAIQSKSVLDSEGDLTLFTREELTKSGL